MKASELLSFLSKAINIYGDLEVKLSEYNNLTDDYEDENVVAVVTALNINGRAECFIIASQELALAYGEV